jgi:hypothetical protein
VLFAVERGGELSGVVRRHDGSPLAGALVGVFQGEAQTEYVFGATDDEGRFEMFGVAPAATATVAVFANFGVANRADPVEGLILLWDGEVELSGESTSAELEVATVSLDLTLEIARPVWPFRRTDPEADSIVGIWVGSDTDGASVTLELDYLAPTECPGLPKEAYKVFLKDMPADETLTIASGTMVEERFARRHVLATPVYHSYSRIRTGRGAQAATVKLYQPRALLSRVVVFGVPSLLVMSVLVVIVVRGTRKRRRAAE